MLGTLPQKVVDRLYGVRTLNLVTTLKVKLNNFRNDLKIMGETRTDLIIDSILFIY